MHSTRTSVSRVQSVQCTTVRAVRRLITSSLFSNKAEYKAHTCYSLLRMQRIKQERAVRKRCPPGARRVISLSSTVAALRLQMHCDGLAASGLSLVRTWLCPAVSSRCKEASQGMRTRCEIIATSSVQKSICPAWEDASCGFDGVRHTTSADLCVYAL